MLISLWKKTKNIILRSQSPLEMRICEKARMYNLIFLSISILSSTLNWWKREGKIKED